MKKAPPKGIKKFIRLEAVLPITILIIILTLYFKFFFDLHVRKGLEWGLTKALGVEVDIENFETKFSDLSLKIQNIEITDSNLSVPATKNKSKSARSEHPAPVTFGDFPASTRSDAAAAWSISAG